MVPEAAEKPRLSDDMPERSPEAAQAAADLFSATAAAGAAADVTETSDPAGNAETSSAEAASEGQNVPVPDGKTETSSAEEAPEEKAPGRRGRRSVSGKKKRRPSVLRTLVRFLVKAGSLALIVWLLLTYVGGVYLCHTSDMYPALRDGDLLITFKLGEYHSGDVVVYEHDGAVCFGRIIGEPTDVIVIDGEGEFTVNGNRPYETIFYSTTVRESDIMTYPYTVKEGEFFVLADARELGADSRNFGPVTGLKGKVVLQLRRRGF